jgi:hypothetical protein
MKTSHEAQTGNIAVRRPEFRQKKDSGSARKEKLQIRKTCNYPNRLNLMIWTVGCRARSNYLRENLVSLVSPPMGVLPGPIDATVRDRRYKPSSD